MNASFVSLRDWLASSCGDRGTLAASIAVIRPLCEVIDIEEFRLARAASADAAMLRGVIASATGARVDGVAAIAPGALHGGMTALIDWYALAAAMNDRHAGALRTALGARAAQTLEGALNDFEVRYESAVWDAVWENFPDELVDRPWQDVVAGVRALVGAFSASAATRDPARFAALAPLVRLCAACVPLGTAGATWYVLFAGTRGH